MTPEEYRPGIKPTEVKILLFDAGEDQKRRIVMVDSKNQIICFGDFDTDPKPPRKRRWWNLI